METKYTLKQAADLLGMTRQGLKYWLDRLGEPLVKDTSGRYVVTDDALNRVKQAREVASEVTSEATSAKVDRETESAENKRRSESEGASEAVSEVASEVPAVTLALVEMLREELKTKNAQIDELNKRLAEVTEALATAQRTAEGSQALHAATMKQLQEQQSTVKPIIQEESAPEPERSVKEEEPEGRRWFVPDDEDEDDEPPVKKKRSFWDWLLGRD